MPYRPSTSPYQTLSTGQAWGQSPQSRVIGCAAIASGTSASAGSANRIYSYLKKTKGNYYAINYFQNAIFGPYMFNRASTGLIFK